MATRAWPTRRPTSVTTSAAGLGNAGDKIDEEVDRAKFRQEHGDDV